MLVLFFVAYYFDHLGILNMGIANLAIWMGVSVRQNNCCSTAISTAKPSFIPTCCWAFYSLQGAYATQHFKFKKHFKFSYQHYGVQVTFIALLAGYFHYYDSLLCAGLDDGIIRFCVLIYRDAFKDKSFYFLLLVILYSYIAVSSLVVRALIRVLESDGISLLLMYFIGSGIGLIFLLINLNKKIENSMIAYNQTWLANLRLQETLKNDLSKERINATEFKAITEKYPVGLFYPWRIRPYWLIYSYLYCCCVCRRTDGTNGFKRD